MSYCRQQIIEEAIFRWRSFGGLAPAILRRCYLTTPNNSLHTEQENTHFIFLDGETIKADNKFFSTARRTKDLKCRQLEQLIHQSLMSKTSNSWKSEQHTCLDTIHTFHRCWRARKPACAENNERTSPTSGRLLVDNCSSCRFSCTKDWYSAVHASTSLPLDQPFTKSPSKNLLNSWKGATSSPPTKIARQNQLKPCPMTDFGAKVDNIQFTNSSRKRRASRQNSVCKY